MVAVQTRACTSSWQSGPPAASQGSREKRACDSDIVTVPTRQAHSVSAATVSSKGTCLALLVCLCSGLCHGPEGLPAFFRHELLCTLGPLDFGLITLST
jgi:hypothetical protein